MENFSAEVIDISWERIYLKATVSVNYSGPFESIHFYLLNKSYYVETEFEIVEQKENQFHLALNITNNGTNRCIANGDYSIFVYQSDTACCEVGYTGTEEQLASWGRSFRYNGTAGVYTVTTVLGESSGTTRVVFQIYNANKKNISHTVSRFKSVKKRKKSFNIIEYIKKIFKKLKKKLQLKKRKRRLRYFVYRIIYRRTAKNREKRILFLSEQDDKLALNMQAIYNRMLERGLDKEYKIYFSLRKTTTKKCTIWSTVKLTVYTALCGIILIDDHVPFLNWFVLYPGNKVIQIWHAGAGFKGVGYSRWGHDNCPGPYSCHRQYAFSISGSASISKFFSEQFGILDEQIIPTGMPRMDAYIDKSNQKRVRAELYNTYPQIVGKKVILFAPTYRGRDRKRAHYPYELIDFDSLYEYCQHNDAVVLFKMHPWVNKAIPIKVEHSDCFFDFFTYENINELFYVTDLLITDYSSCMYEFILMDKPMILFAFDKVSFAVSRGFHRDYDTNIPGKLCETFEEVMIALKTEDYEFEKVPDFRSKYFEFIDSNSTDRVIDWLICGNLPDEYQEKLCEKLEYVRQVRQKNFKRLIKSSALRSVKSPESASDVLPEMIQAMKETESILLCPAEQSLMEQHC